MKHFYYAVQYEIQGKEMACVFSIAENENIVSFIQRNKVKLMQPCGSHKDAGKVAEYWNNCSRKNGTCAI